MGREHHRRAFLRGAIGLGLLTTIALAACSKDQVQQTIDGIKALCSLAITAATIADILKADPTLSYEQIVKLVCDQFQAQKAAGKLSAPPKGEIVKFDVVTPNGKKVPIEATVQ